MTIALKGSGTNSNVVGTEHYVLNVASAGTYTFHVNKLPLTAGDVLELRIYTMVLNTTATQVAYFTRFDGAQPTDDMVAISVPVSTDLSTTSALVFSIKQTFGAAKTIDWKVIVY